MHKIGIVTICDLKPNYGNRLQNYAIVKVLDKLGLKSVTYSVEKESVRERIKCIVNKLTRFKFSKKRVESELYHIKCDKFKAFNRKKINIKKLRTTNKLSENTDYFIVGSDQVWNPTWFYEYPLRKNVYLLSFAKPNQKIALAPSFGLESLPVEWKKWFADNLGTFEYLSVREDAGAEIIKEITGRPAEVLIDPTLMLSGDEWMDFAFQCEDDKIDYSKPYILTYFLGEKTEIIISDISSISRENNLVVYNLKDYSQPEIFIADPMQFVKLIVNASLILTDSFHACVFSFLFEKPFLVYNRQSKEGSMISRVETLLKTFHLERKYVDSGLNNQLFEHDYFEGYKRLEIEKEKFINYLINALGLVNPKT